MSVNEDQIVLLIPIELHAAGSNRPVGIVDDLAASIAELGVLQALVVDRTPPAAMRWCAAPDASRRQTSRPRPDPGIGPDLPRQAGQAGGQGV